MRAHLLALALLTAAALTACAGGAATPTPSDAAVQRTGEPAPSADAEAPTADISEAGLAALLARAADEAGVAVDEVRIVLAEEVTWPDGSLGCPEPGMGYTQALVPGYRVVLDIGGDELSFHAAQGGEFRFCDDPEPPAG